MRQRLLAQAPDLLLASDNISSSTENGLLHSLETKQWNQGNLPIKPLLGFEDVRTLPEQVMQLKMHCSVSLLLVCLELPVIVLHSGLVKVVYEAGSLEDNLKHRMHEGEGATRISCLLIITGFRLQPDQVVSMDEGDLLFALLLCNLSLTEVVYLLQGLFHIIIDEVIVLLMQRLLKACHH